MKYLLVFMLSSTCWAKPAIENDALLHVTTSAAITGISYAKYRDNHVSKKRALVYAIVTSLALGLSKEYVFDSRPDTGDLLADAVGTATAAWVLEF